MLTEHMLLLENLILNNNKLTEETLELINKTNDYKKSYEKMTGESIPTDNYKYTYNMGDVLSKEELAELIGIQRVFAEFTGGFILC